jgi:hypothetical protein
MTKQVKVTNQMAVNSLSFFRILEGKSPMSGEGDLLAVNPTLDEFVAADENFAHAVANGVHLDDDRYDAESNTMSGILFYDNGAQRVYFLAEKDVEIKEVN